MSCSKYTLTNSGSTVITFNYRRCDDSMWEYQVGLLPNETKNIWLINGTYSTAQANSIVLVNQGAFPPPNVPPTPTPTPSTTAAVTPTPSATSTPTATPGVTPTSTSTGTPTQTPTMTQTPTNTQTMTPTQTQTQTQTPTNTQTMTPTPTETDTPLRNEFVCLHNESNASDACYSEITATIFGDDPVFANNLNFYGCSNGSCPEVNLQGYYVYSGVLIQLNSSGLRLSFSSCPATPTPTSSLTPTPTPEPTPTATPTFAQFSFGTGTTSNDACSDYSISPTTIYGYPSAPDFPDYGDTLFLDSSLTIFAPDGFYSDGNEWCQVSGGFGGVFAGGLC